MTNTTDIDKQFSCEDIQQTKSLSLKYFTYNQCPNPHSIDLMNNSTIDSYWNFWDALWEDDGLRWLKNIQSIAARFDKSVYRCLSAEFFHDWKLDRMDVARKRTRKTSTMQVALIMSMGAEVYGKTQYELLFKDVLKFEVKTKENYRGNGGIGEWGYSEILPLGDKTLLFEMLFSSGTTLHIVFPNKCLKMKKLRDWRDLKAPEVSVQQKPSQTRSQQ